MTTAEAREALDSRKALVNEFLQGLDEAGPPPNRTECEMEMEKFLENQRHLDEEIKVFEKKAPEVEEFINKMKDDSGRIERDRLLTYLDSLSQSVFQHALLVVAAKEKDLSFIRNLSAEHRKALGILDRRSVEDSLSNTIVQKKKELEEASIELAKQKQELVKSNRELAEKDRELMGKTDEINTARAEVATLKTQIGKKDESILELKASKDELFNQMTTNIAEAHALTDKLATAERRLSELNGRVPQLEDQIKDRELRLAKFFAAQSSWEGNDYGGWLPFARVITDADSVVGSDPPTTLPWVLLEAWRDDKEQESTEYSHPSDLTTITCKLYGFALGGHYHEEALCLLGLLVRRLAKDSSAHVASVLLALDKYLGIAKELQVSSASIHLQIFLLGLWRVASLVARRWPSVPAVESVRDRLGKHLDGSPLLKIEELLGDANLEATFREKSPKECLFSEELVMGFVRLPELRNWVFVVDFANWTVRMFHPSRSAWTSIYDITVTAAKPGKDLVIPVHNKGQFDWIQKNMFVKNS